MTTLLGRLLALWAIWRRGLRGPVPGPPAADPDPRRRELPEDERAEILTALLLFAAGALAVAFVVLYIVYPDTPLLGATGGLALVAVAAALMLASLRVVPQVTAVEERSVLDHEQQEEVAGQVREGVEGVSRRGLLVTAAGVCGCGLGAMALAPVASIGPRVGNRLAASAWRADRLLVDESGRPVSADDLVAGGLLTAFPQGADKGDLGSPVVVVRVDPTTLRLPTARRDWAPEGLVAYSKICTHAGCAVSEYRAPLSPGTAPGGPALVCPCHYSTFDVTRAAKVTFGPAGRPLPQLPLRIDAQRRLRAAGPLSGPPGPAWWGVGGGRA